MKPQLIIKKQKPTSQPRFVLLQNSRALIAGIEHHDLDAICNMAAIHVYDQLKKKPQNSEGQKWYTKMLWILNTLKESREKEYDKTRPIYDTTISLKDKLKENEKERQFWRRIFNKLK